ncbi:hypothetical protein [Paroceanicella profunda]|uniref:hypothetical protein n=1 Tax=Paroceanicella profunda TaxID=2579971 RepID=UPI00197F3E85|nr:hypothetical protein [Paroceanicella profunda]
MSRTGDPGAPDRGADDMLDALFAEARRAEPGPSEAFYARILADAAEVAAARAAPPRPVAAAAPGPDLLARIAGLFGGWRAVAGLAACAALGFWVGFAGPDSLTDLPVLDTITGADTTLAYEQTSSEFALLVDTYPEI